MNELHMYILCHLYLIRGILTILKRHFDPTLHFMTRHCISWPDKFLCEIIIRHTVNIHIADQYTLQHSKTSTQKKYFRRICSKLSDDVKFKDFDWFGAKRVFSSEGTFYVFYVLRGRVRSRFDSLNLSLLQMRPGQVTE